MVKVEELKASMEHKRAARVRFDAYVRAQQEQPQSAVIDYTKWDLWCPEDEEDELLAECTPNNPQLHAMEKDIDERHARCAATIPWREAATQGEGRRPCRAAAE